MLPRSLNEGRHGGGGLGKRPKSGAHIITPFEITEIGYAIISFFFFPFFLVINTKVGYPGVLMLL